MSLAPATTKSNIVEEVAAKAVAAVTYADLLRKPRRVSSFVIYSQDADGTEVGLTLKYQALSQKAYDALIEANPPTQKEKAAGTSYNQDTFAPALIAAVSLVPKLSLEQAKELYTSEDWAGGEVTDLFINALKVCNAGLNVPFNSRD
jgi:hypothetical protein